MEQEKVKVVSTVESRLGVKVPEMRFNRQWLKKGAAVMIDKNTLEELMYDFGFRKMIETGMLYIEDMAVKKELGLEPEDAKAPVNIVVLTDKDMRHYMVTMPLAQFKEKVEELKNEQLQTLIDFAIKNRLGDIDKSNYIKQLCGKDIVRAIQLNDLDKEA